MADPVVGITNGVPTSGTGTITTLGQTLVDGANASIGATTDPAVAAGAAGSLLAKLRSISRDLVGGIVLQAGSAVIGAVTQSGSWVISAGTALIGKVGIDQTTDGTTNKVAANLYVGGAVADKGVGTGGAATPRFAIDSSQVTTTGTAGSPSTQVLSVQGVAGGTPQPATMSVTATANGGTASRINAAGSTNATNLKTSAGQVYTIDVFNVAAYSVFLKIYNKASSPTVGTDTPVMTIPIQAGGGYSKTWPMGYPLGTGISYAITKLQADSDTTAVTAGDLTGNIIWI